MRVEVYRAFVCFCFFEMLFGHVKVFGRRLKIPLGGWQVSLFVTMTWLASETGALAYQGLAHGCNVGAEIITNTVLGVPYYNYSMMGPKTLFQLLRPLY